MFTEAVGQIGPSVLVYYYSDYRCWAKSSQGTGLSFSCLLNIADREVEGFTEYAELRDPLSFVLRGMRARVTLRDYSYSCLDGRRLFVPIYPVTAL